VLFPGRGYNVDMPLLYYAQFKYTTKGYECLRINYGDSISEGKTLDDVKDVVLNQIKCKDLSLYNEVLFISKSMGTVLAGWIAEMIINNNIRHIYLTPLNDTLQYIRSGENISVIIAGTADKLLDTNILKEHCKHEKIKLELIENAGHGLEIYDDMNVNIENLKRIVELY